jgi:hypothetical protein
LHKEEEEEKKKRKKQTNNVGLKWAKYMSARTHIFASLFFPGTFFSFFFPLSACLFPSVMCDHVLHHFIENSVPGFAPVISLRHDYDTDSCLAENKDGEQIDVWQIRTREDRTEYRVMFKSDGLFYTIHRGHVKPHLVDASSPPLPLPFSPPPSLPAHNS